MIQNESTWTASELIYLFVDGEADDLQKAQLFGALANDSDLQAELADAIRINAAVRDESVNAAPPAAVTASLFEKAGIGAVASGSLSGAAGTLGTVAGGTSAGVWSSMLKKIGLPLVTGFLGAALALFLLPESGLVESQPIAASEANRTFATMSHGPGGGVDERRGESSVSSSLSSDDLLSSGNQSGRTTRMQKGRQDHIETRNDFGGAVSDEAKGRSADGSETETQVIPTLRQENDGEESVRNHFNRPEPHLLTLPAVLTSPSFAEGGEELYVRSISDLSPLTDNASPLRFSVQLRGILGLETFPHRSLETGKSSPLENLAITAFWHPSEHHAFGVEVGRERHPLYVQDDGTVEGEEKDIIFLDISGTGGGSPDITITDDPNDPGGRSVTAEYIPTGSKNEEAVPQIAPETLNGYRLEPMLEWVGLTYQFKGGAIDSRGTLRPYIQMMGGGTTSGPIAKGTLGISWKPEDRISLGLGVEGTSLFYRRDGEWFSSRKLGATYAVQVEF